MFANDKAKANQNNRRVAPARQAAVTILTSGCHFTGKLYCRGSSRIGGKIEGEIISEGLLIIEEGAHISATILADEAIIQGTVKGKLRAKNRIELAPTCRIEGDIVTPSLVVFEGAQFNGRSQMAPKETQQVGGKVIEATGFGNSARIPDLRPDIHSADDSREPEISVAKLNELPQPT